MVGKREEKGGSSPPCKTKKTPPGFLVRFLSRGRCIFRMQKLKMSLFFFYSSEWNKNKHLLLLLFLLLTQTFPRLSISLSLSPYGVFLEPLSSPHPSVSISRIKGAYSFSCMACFCCPLLPRLLPEFPPQPGTSESTEVEQLLFRDLLLLLE